jgi:CHASE1-domain containing sensor protein
VLKENAKGSNKKETAQGKPPGAGKEAQAGRSKKAFESLSLEVTLVKEAATQMWLLDKAWTSPTAAEPRR